MRYVWVNGVLVTETEAVVSVFDHGMTVGDGVFETVKAIDGVPFALGRHLERLVASARGLGLPEPNVDTVRAAVEETLAAQLDRNEGLRLRITYTGGLSPLGSDRGDAGPTLVVAAASLPLRGPTASVVTVPWPRNERGALSGLKTTSYAENVVALGYARSRDGDEALCADTTGRLCEGTGSNIVLEVDGRLVTPTLATGCLAGVTRALVLEWCDVVEADAPLEAVRTTSEAFLTSTTRDVQPVHAVDGRQLEAPGQLTGAAMRSFAAGMAQGREP